MKIGILGAGHIGKALAKKFIKAGYSVTLSNSRGIESLQPLVEELGALATAGTNEDVANSDIVVIAVRWEKIPEVLNKIKKQLEGKIVIDVSNRPKDSNDFPEKPASTVVAGLIPDSKIVKAFNTLYARLLDADPAVDNGKPVVFISGDDQTANNVVNQIATQFGFAVIDLGNLEQSAPLVEMGKVFSGLNLISYPS